MFTKNIVCALALLSLTVCGFAQEKTPASQMPAKLVPATVKKSDDAKPVETKKSPSKKSEAKKTEGKKTEGKKAFEGTVSLNKATAKELESLPGIGPATAARIVEYRTSQGKFTELSQLLEVKGIGEKKLTQLRPHLTLD